MQSVNAMGTWFPLNSINYRHLYFQEPKWVISPNELVINQCFPSFLLHFHVQWYVSENNFDSEAIICSLETRENYLNLMPGKFEVRFLLLLMMYNGYVPIFLTVLHTHPCLVVFMPSMTEAILKFANHTSQVVVDWMSLDSCYPHYLGFS